MTSSLAVLAPLAAEKSAFETFVFSPAAVATIIAVVLGVVGVAIARGLFSIATERRESTAALIEALTPLLANLQPDTRPIVERVLAEVGRHIHTATEDVRVEVHENVAVLKQTDKLLAQGVDEVAAAVDEVAAGLRQVANDAQVPEPEITQTITVAGTLFQRLGFAGEMPTGAALATYDDFVAAAAAEHYPHNVGRHSQPVIKDMTDGNALWESLLSFIRQDGSEVFPWTHVPGTESYTHGPFTYYDLVRSLHNGQVEPHAHLPADIHTALPGLKRSDIWQQFGPRKSLSVR